MDPVAAQGLYTFFARLFLREVDAPFAAALAGDVGRALLPGFAASDEPARLGTSVFAEDFAHLTVVDAVPYASFYLRPDAAIEAGTDNPAVAFLRAYGFEADLAVARAVAADHLGLLLELAARLCAVEAGGGDPAARASARAVRRALLADHLLPWAPVYLLAVRRVAATRLYREGAEVLLDWLLQDHAALEPT